MRGLLCIEPLYHQIVAGNKTQTRRSSGLELVNGRNATKKQPAIITNPDDWTKTTTVISLKQIARDYVSGQHSYWVEFVDKKYGKLTICKSRYKIGEVLYLKEPVAKSLHHYLTPNGYMYKYGMPANYVANYFGRQVGFNESVKWQNKLFMPASAARAFIRITDIRCERLLDISDHDCIAEGIEIVTATNNGYKNYLAKPKDGVLEQFTTMPSLSFLSLYKFANKVKDVPNLWVFVYNFEYLPNYKA